MLLGSGQTDEFRLLQCFSIKDIQTQAKKRAELHQQQHMCLHLYILCVCTSSIKSTGTNALLSVLLWEWVGNYSEQLFPTGSLWCLEIKALCRCVWVLMRSKLRILKSRWNLWWKQMCDQHPCQLRRQRLQQHHEELGLLQPKCSECLGDAKGRQRFFLPPESRSASSSWLSQCQPWYFLFMQPLFKAGARHVVYRG